MPAFSSEFMTIFERNLSCVTYENLSIRSNNQYGTFNQKRCSSTVVLTSSLDQYSKTNAVNYERFNQSIQFHIIRNLSWIQRCKQRIITILKEISKLIIVHGKLF